MIGLIGAGLSMVGGIAKGIMGARQAKKARQAIDAYQRQDLTNIYKDLDVITSGADLQREELARASATGMQALQTAGQRALIGGVGNILDANRSQSRQIGVDLDQQFMDRQRLQASDEARIQQMTERREEQDLAGLGQQLATGQQNLMSGIGDVAGAVGSMGRMAGAGALGGVGAAAGGGNPFASTEKFLADFNPGRGLTATMPTRF